MLSFWISQSSKNCHLTASSGASVEGKEFLDYWVAKWLLSWTSHRESRVWLVVSTLIKSGIVIEFSWPISSDWRSWRKERKEGGNYYGGLNFSLISYPLTNPRIIARTSNNEWVISAIVLLVTSDGNKATSALKGWFVCCNVLWRPIGHPSLLQIPLQTLWSTHINERVRRRGGGGGTIQGGGRGGGGGDSLIWSWWQEVLDSFLHFLEKTPLSNARSLVFHFGCTIFAWFNWLNVISQQPINPSWNLSKAVASMRRTKRRSTTGGWWVNVPKVPKLSNHTPGVGGPARW